jgi:hypothetical protein
MNEFISTLVDFLLCYCAFKLAYGFYQLNVAAKEEKQNELKEFLNTIVHEVEEEKHGNMIYWFDKDDQTFIAQGQTNKDIVEILKKYYSHHIFIVNNEYILSGPDWIPEKNKKTTLNF